MSFLSEEQAGEIGTLLADNPVVSDSPVPDSPPTPDTSSDSPADVNVEAVNFEQQGQETTTSTPESSPDTASVNAEESGHRVPYNRFKDVNDRKNHYRSQAKSLKKQLAEAQSQLEQFQSAPKQQEAPEERDWLDDYLGQEEAQNPYEKQFNDLNTRLYEFEVQQAGVSLAQEVAKAQDKYPGVPEQILYKAVVDDGDADVMEVAERYHEFIDMIQQQAIDRYTKENKPAPKKAAPRPRKSGSTPSNQARPSKNKSPKTMKDAKEALLQHFKDNPIF
tara:strand:+ start:83 stop:913 length:831 start_codon:yes stop_codon:yes gene_type:complete